jgi:hypothetical protein
MFRVRARLLSHDAHQCIDPLEYLANSEAVHIMESTHHPACFLPKIVEFVA